MATLYDGATESQAESLGGDFILFCCQTNLLLTDFNSAKQATIL